VILDALFVAAGAWVVWSFGRILYVAARSGHVDAGPKPLSGQKVILTRAENPKLFWLNVTLAAILLPLICYGLWLIINGRLGS
jgi:hypothetical protein